jgi:hypothetical protein
MKDEDSVVFRLSPPAGQEKTALAWFVGQLENALESRGITPIGKKVSSLSYGVLSYPVSQGHISIFVFWPARGDVSSWQIRTRYGLRWPRRMFRPVPPEDMVEQMERIRGWIERFLLTRDAHRVQWMSAAHAEQMLR